MSVLIKDMTMPNCCMVCPFSEHGSIDEWEYFCILTHDHVGNFDDKKWRKNWRPKNCPLEEIKETGNE